MKYKICIEIKGSNIKPQTFGETDTLEEAKAIVAGILKQPVLTDDEWSTILSAIWERLEHHDEFVDQDHLDQLEDLARRLAPPTPTTPTNNHD